MGRVKLLWKGRGCCRHSEIDVQDEIGGGGKGALVGGRATST